jgi:serine/threonine protein phosphatase PrpC
MGGAAAGEVASKIAIESIARSAAKFPVHINLDTLGEALSDAVKEAGREIRKDVAEHPDRRGMGTTCTAAVLRGEELLVAQVGDSRAYVMRGGELVQITRDQNLVSHLVQLGHLKPEEADGAPGSNVILQALGSTETIQVELTVAKLRRGDRVLLCSDGLSGLVSNAKIAEVLARESDPMRSTQRLIELANEAGGRDNITVVLGSFEGEGLALAAENEALAHGAFGSVSFSGPDLRIPMAYSGWRVFGVAVCLLVAGFVAMRLAQAKESQRPHDPADIVAKQSEESGPPTAIPPEQAPPRASPELQFPPSEPLRSPTLPQRPNEVASPPRSAPQKARPPEPRARPSASATPTSERPAQGRTVPASSAAPSNEGLWNDPGPTEVNLFK